MAEVSLTDLRIPLAWRQQSEANLGDRKKFAIFCTVSCGAQVRCYLIFLPVLIFMFSDIRHWCEGGG